MRTVMPNFDGEYLTQESGYLEIRNQVKSVMDNLRYYYTIDLQYCGGKFYGYRQNKNLAKKYLDQFKDYLFAPASIEFLFRRFPTDYDEYPIEDELQEIRIISFPENAEHDYYVTILLFVEYEVDMNLKKFFINKGYDLLCENYQVIKCY